LLRGATALACFSFRQPGFTPGCFFPSARHAIIAALPPDTGTTTVILTVELSMYPLQDNYLALISDFIRELNTKRGLRCVTTPTATMVTGEYAVVMQALAELLEWSWNTHGKAVFVAKFIPDYDPA
jgi:uncharacterized protein YqgV (UPF0045/DUF77 family)